MSRHRRGSVVGTALSLMASTVLSAVLTFGFWIAAARFAEPDAVGRISAGVASITLLAAVAQLNLHSLYGRFLPAAGRRTARLVLGGYAASTGTAAALATGYLLLGLGGDAVGADRRAQGLFLAGVIATAIFLVQDGVLTGLRRAGAVPAKNAVSAFGKLALLPALAGSTAGAAGGDGLLLAWVLPVVAVMVAWNGWILLRLVPAHVRDNPDAPPLKLREVLRFASAEYVNGIVTNVVAFLPPLLVTHVAGTVGGAYFYLPWVIGVSVTTMLWQTVTSFVAEASTAESRGDHTRVATHLRRTVALIAAVAGGGGLFLAAAAEPLLRLLGAGYAAQGTTGLRLIGLSLPFTGVIVLYAGFAAMEKRMGRMVLAQSAAAGAFLAATWFNLPHHGLVAPALAQLLTQATLALTLLPGLVTRITAMSPPAPAAPAEIPRPRPARIAETPRRTGSRHPRPAVPRPEALTSSRRSTW